MINKGKPVQRHPTLRKDVAIGIFLFLLVPPMISSYSQTVGETIILSNFGGTIFYVGGSGAGNYTRIQDAIDASSTGDTIYVYDDSSPYLESIIIDKSIILMGEDKTSTEINGSSLDTSLDTVTVLADDVTISQFRITHNQGYHYQAAVKIKARYTILSNCIITENEWVGVYLADASFCHIDDCELYENLVAIYLVNSINNVLLNCVCHDNADAITIFQASNDNRIIHCTCTRNHFDSILVQQSSGNQITDCVCQDGYDGISLPYAPNTKMRNNSMVNNYANFGIGSSSVSDLYCDIDTSNTINGKPMYYLIEQDNLLFDETTEIGFLGLVSCQNIIVKNCSFTHNFEGILLAGTTDSTIENCSFRSNDGHGMYLISCHNNTVETCSFQDGFWDGVFLYDSSYNLVKNCSYHGSLAGVKLGLSTYNTLLGQTMDQCNVGISFDTAGNNVLKDNEMIHCGLQVTGGDPGDYRNDVDASNMVNGRPVYYYINQTNRTIPSDAGQVILTTCTGCIVSQSNLSDASVGLELAYCSMNTIEDNIFTNNGVVAIDLDGSDNNENSINDNIIQGNNYGIDIDSSNLNSIHGNLLTDNGMGFSFDSCWKNSIIGNTIQDGSYGMSFDTSSNNILINNTIRNTSVFGLYLFSSQDNVLDSNAMINCSLMMYGNEDTEYLNYIYSNNTVNGKPVYYILGRKQITVPDDAGEVILISSDHCTIKNLHLDKGTIGILLAYSSHNIIQGNIIANQSMIAVDLGSANNDNNIIMGNIIQDNGYGVDLEYSKGNIIRKNRFASNGHGIFLFDTFNTLIWRNTLSTNSYGISVAKANGSKIFFNNIYQNYAYGLSAEACVVSAPWNWWGAISGPNANGNGDRLRVTEEGQITYAPWLRLPVLFTGALRFQSMNTLHYTLMDTTVKTKGAIPIESPLTGYYQMDLYGLKNINDGTECVPPKTIVEP
jgi:trimeric autotransporter adhesin